MQTRYVMFAVLVPLALAGCGQGSGQQGYLAQPNSNSTQFLQVTRSGSALTGNLQSASIASTDPTTVATFNAAFTGTVDSNNNLTLTFPQGLGFATSISGSYSGDHIQLSVPQSDGTLSTEDFAPSNTNSYNSAVQTLQQQASQALADQQAATAAQQQAQLEAKERAAVDQAISTVNGDFTSIASDINSYKGLYADVNADVQQANKDVNVAYAAVQKVSSEGRNNPNCGYDAGVVSYDAGVVQYDLGTVTYQQGIEQSDVQTLNGATSSLDSDFQKMQAAEAAISSYQPSAVPTAAQISQAHSQVASANSQADAIIAAQLKQVNTWLTQANGYAANATAICG
jgi:hypothetical protein